MVPTVREPDSLGCQLPQIAANALPHLVALATNLADKAVSLFYEINFHKDVSEAYAARCKRQIMDALSALETDRAARSGPYWFGEKISHSDIAVACALRHFNDAFPGIVSMADYPALKAHCAKLEAMPVFEEISQVFIPPA